MKQQHKFSLSYYLVVFFTIILFESIFFSGTAVKEIPYSKFRNLLARDQIQSVIVEENRIFGLEKSADIVRNMLTVYGMSETLPNRSLVETTSTQFLGQGPSTQRRSENLEALIDQESQAIIDAAYRSAKQILTGHRRELDAMAALLLEKEKIDGSDIQRILESNMAPPNTCTGTVTAAW
jgi:cell division protease FtsH